MTTVKMLKTVDGYQKGKVYALRTREGMQYIKDGVAKRVETVR